MKPPSVKRITANDLGDFGQKLAPFLNQFNNFSQQVVDLLSGNLTLRDNIQSEIIIYTGILNPFVKEKILLTSLKSVPQCVILGKIIQVNPSALMVGSNVTIEWDTDGKYIFLNLVNGTFTANAVYQLNLLVF